jgi:transcriptional regulator with XRE-family HTH domain
MGHPSAPRRRAKLNLGSLVGLARRVEDRRLSLRLTQTDVADLAGVGVASVRALEAGKSTPSLEIALRVLDALGLAVGVADLPTLRADPRIVIVEGQPDDQPVGQPQ